VPEDFHEAAEQALGDARVDFADDKVGFGHDAVKAGDGKEALVGAVVLFADDKERGLHVFGGNGDGEVVRVGFVGGDDSLGAVNARFAQGDGFGADAADLSGGGRQVGVDDERSLGKLFMFSMSLDKLGSQ